MADELKQTELTLDSKLLDEHVDVFQLDEDKLSLAQLIPRIIFERGSFLNLTEEALEKEIERESKEGEEDGTESAELGDQEDGNDDTDSETNTQSTISINEQFFKNKTEVLSHIQAALNESSLSLDFISLLISCVRPAAGTISMSEHLKKFVPPGSLNADSVISTISQQEKQERYKEDKVIGQGWKLSSLETSAANLRDASARLSEEVMREKIFWDTVKKNFNNKEILYKTRDKTSGKRIFGVKYGYADSGSTYRVKGNAILKPLETGQIEFTPTTSTSDNFRRALRIRILSKEENEDDYTIVGESSVARILKADDSIRSQIEKARYFIFEEELFNQLIEEASNLLAYNITVENESKFSINLHNEIIEIEHIEYDDEVETPSVQDESNKTHNDRANIIATYLRLMLTIKFKKNLESRRQPIIVKPPATSRLQAKPYSLILRPLIGQFRHEQKVQRLHESIKFLLQDIEGTSFTLKRYSNLTKKKLEADPFRKISSPPSSTFTLKIGESLKIVIVIDSFDFVNCVTHVKAYHKDDLFGDDQKKVLDVSFEELKQIEECLEWLIQQYKK